MKRQIRERACERCAVSFLAVDDRFCPKCRKAVRKELAAVGYLTRRARPTWYHPENRGAALDVKYGHWDGSTENALRALEDG